MKKFYGFSLVAFTITCVSGCQKLHDYVEDHPDADIKDCPIMQINYSFLIGYSNGTPVFRDDTLAFSYNSFGDPVSIIRSLGPSDGAPNYFFKYDKKHRLTDFIGIYGTDIGMYVGTAELWHRYFYENPGSSKIVLDSSFLWPLSVNGVLIRDPKRGSTEHYLTYDKKGRIIKDSTHDTDVFTAIRVNIYSYDAAGNLTDHGVYDNFGTIHYGNNIWDDKINIHRTNKIWMFIDRDYSVNNPFKADSYNSIGLPTKVSFHPTPLQGMPFVYYGLTDPVIAYKCK